MGDRERRAGRDVGAPTCERHGGAPAGHRPRLVGVAGIVLTTLLLGGGTGAALTAQQDALVGEEEVIVVLDEGVDPEAAARELGVEPTYVYEEAINGFAARVPARVVEAARRKAGVAEITRDARIRAFAQTVPTGVRRIAADENPTAAIDGAGGDVEVDIAILDTGIARHPDLTIAGGKSCIGETGWDDGHAHGTHVAGIAGARDDRRGVVGVAPGARLWAVKVLDDQGVGSVSSLVCGLDWVYAHREKIDVVNMSIGGRGIDGDCAGSALHRAVCNVVNRGGIPVVAAAGNRRRDADGTVPASFREAITVSAFVDSDGEPGAAGPGSKHQPDDAFARRSNFGPDIDIAAPGGSILSTWRRGRTGLQSGTSVAAPHVAGAIGLYLSLNPDASVAEVRTWLQRDASRRQDEREGFTGDPDDTYERVLYLGGDEG